MKWRRYQLIRESTKPIRGLCLLYILPSDCSLARVLTNYKTMYKLSSEQSAKLSIGR